MPTYQYACPDCGFEFEKQQKFTDEPIKRCPKCGKRSVYRVVNKVAVTFKGSGWYITDSKSDKAKHSVETKHSEAESGETKADGKADSESKKSTKSKAKAEQD